jgi:hypothetical protein
MWSSSKGVNNTGTNDIRSEANIDQINTHAKIGLFFRGHDCVSRGFSMANK